MESVIRPLLHEFGIHDIQDAKLGDQLHKYLFGRKYLIILDDIWDSQAWAMICRFLPDNNNGSRILLTTRILDVARSIGSCSPYKVQFLDAHKSWDLLCKMVFEQDVCPSELKTIGKEIATGCKGLPLSIVVIGGILKMSDNTSEYWAYVAQNISSIISRGDDEHCLRILSLSYQELPIHLKPCFLYMATFPADYVIRVSEVIMLWEADGFLKPCGDDTFEEAASKNLKDLINRNLIMLKKTDSRGFMKSLILHDLVREFCFREAQKERFLHVDDGSSAIECQRRFVVHHSDPVSFPTTQQESLARSFISFVEWDSSPDMMLSNLLRVYSAPYIGRNQADIMQLVNLRFIRSVNDDMFVEPSHRGFLISEVDGGFYKNPSSACSISFFWKLETLIVDLPRGSQMYSLSAELWKLPRIKHLIFSRGVIFPDPPTGHTDSVLSNLHTLKNVIILSDKVLYMIPNIKNLRIQHNNLYKKLPPGFWIDLVHCPKLETLYLHGVKNSFELSGGKLFLNSLKKLTLSQCSMSWERMKIVGSLPTLEVLRLKWNSFIGEEWNSCEGEFQSLKVLSIDIHKDLLAWRVESSSPFPSFEHLRLRWMDNLEEIPQAFGESMTLKSIQLDRCKDSVVTSAKQILDEQESYGYDDLTVHVRAEFPHQDNERQMKLESLASDRFHVKCHHWT